ncbi:hypothetical protein M0805_004896 [Coniferiporia weirii]|nr:hypothetical protein M0805_004896 [Coniferiporia weirii]
MAGMSSHYIDLSVSQPSADTLPLLVLVGDILVPIKAAKNEHIASIFDLVKLRDSRVEEYLNGLKVDHCQYSRFEPPVPKSAFLLKDNVIVTNKAQVLETQTYATVSVSTIDAVEETFQSGVPLGVVCLLIERSDDAAETRLKQVNETLFNCLTVRIGGTTWKPSDISRNDVNDMDAQITSSRGNRGSTTGRTEQQPTFRCANQQQTDGPAPNMPSDVVEMLARLSAPRRYMLNPDSAKTRMDFSKKMLGGEFGEYFTLRGGSVDSASVESELEFEYFARVTTFEQELHLDVPKKGVRRSELIAAITTSVFIAALGKMLFIIGEVVSDPDGSDRWRMLCQAIVLARVGSYLLKEKSARTFVVMAVYVTNHYIAERYFVYQPKREDRGVDILCDEYDLKKSDEGRQFLREMYNYGEEIRRIGEEFDSEKFDMLKMLTDIGKDLSSLSSRPSAEGTRTGGRSASKSALGAIAEERPFSRPDVQAAMVELGLRPDPYILLGHPSVAFVYKDTKRYYAKFLRPDRDDEFRILSFLSRFDSPRNPVVRWTAFCAVNDGMLVVLPDSGVKVTSYENLSHDLLPVAQQLLEGVAFLHEKEVAHNDLKPSNIVVDKTTGRVSIIDFNLGVLRVDQLDGRFIGTKGWTAPEVGGGEPYNPMWADVWAAGNVVSELCAECPEASGREFLVGLSKNMMSSDPKKRPSMKDTVKCIKGYVESTNCVSCEGL